MNKPKDALKWVSVAAALAVTATAEYDLAVAIGVNKVVAAAVPAALDAYVLRALQRNKEVLTSVLAMVAVNAASHLQHAGMLPVDWILTTAVSAIAPLVLWRVHALTDPGTWRLRKLWGASTPVAAEHGGEHERTPDEDTSTGDGAREHTRLVTCDWCAWDECPAYLLDLHKRESCAERSAHRVDAGHNAHPYGFEVSTVEELDVPPWLQDAQAETGRVLASVPVPAPAFAPYADHVDAEHGGEHTSTDPVHDWLKGEMASTERHLTAVPPLPAAFTRRTDRADAEHGGEHASDHDGINLGHVSTGVLQPADTRHMERARVLMARTGGVPTVRALKQTLSTGTPVAQRVRAALAIEHTTSTDGGTA